MWSIIHTISIAFMLMNFSAAYGSKRNLIQKFYQKYALLGSTVSLSLEGQSQDLTQIRWKKEDFLIARDGAISPDFNGTFLLNATDGSLIIKNVTMNDSHHYKAFIGRWEDIILDHHLIVEGMVSKPIIETDRNHTAVNSTNDCRISVKCSVDDESVMYDCERQICTLSQTPPQTRVNITVAVTDSGNVECTSSNHVSKRKTSKAISNTCSDERRGPEEKSSFSLVLTLVISCGIAGIIVVCLLAVLFSRKNQPQKDSHPEAEITTVYSVVNKPRISTENSAANDTATIVYDVPSKRAMPVQSASVQMPKETREQPLEGQPVTANAGTEEESENDQHLTVYWKLGQK